MGVALAGVFSGINSDAIISQILAIDSLPMTRLQTQKIREQSKQAAVDSISAVLTQFQSLTSSLQGTDKISYVSAASSDSQVLTATAASGATEGTHTVVVNRLASAAKQIQAGVVQKETWTLGRQVDSADEEFLSADEISDSAGEDYRFVFQFGSEAAVTVDLSAYDAGGITLNQLVSEINAAAGYTAASAVPSDGKYQLQVRAKDAGADRGLAVTDSNSVAALASLDEFTKAVSGAAGVDTLVGTGQFVYTYNGVTRTIQTTSTTTLGGLRDLINKDSVNPGITASILEHQVDDDHVFHLVLTGNSSGANYGIAIGSGTTLAGFGPGEDWTESQQAANSQVRVDGYPASGWIERSSNTLSDVITGVTLSLNGLSAEGVSVTVNRNTPQLTNNLQNLVSIYNALSSSITQYTDYDTSTKTGSILQGDSTILSVRYGVRAPLLAAPGGFTSANAPFWLAAQIGLTIDKDGKLSLDATVLNSALSQDYQGVLNLIGAKGDGTSDTSNVQFQSAESTTVGGTYEVEVNYSSAGNVTSARIRTQGQSDWRAAVVSGNEITGRDGAPEKGLRLTATWDGHSTLQSANVTVRQGLAATLSSYLSQVLDETTGVLALRKQASDNQIKTLDSNIARWQTRLDNREKTLKATYARLEQTLALLDAQRAAVTALAGTYSSTLYNSNNSASSG